MPSGLHALAKNVRLRRWLARGLIVLAPVSIVIVDYAKRHERFADFTSFDRFFYFASAALGVVLWTALFLAGTRVRGMSRWPVRVFIGIAALLAVGGQLYTYSRYSAYMNYRSVLVGTTFLPSIGQQLWFDRWAFLGALIPCGLVAAAVLMAAIRLAPNAACANAPSTQSTGQPHAPHLPQRAPHPLRGPPRSSSTAGTTTANASSCRKPFACIAPGKCSSRSSTTRT